MAHIIHLEESSFIELVNTPFSPLRFTEEELSALRELELSLYAQERS